MMARHRPGVLIRSPSLTALREGGEASARLCQRLNPLCLVRRWGGEGGGTPRCLGLVGTLFILT